MANSNLPFQYPPALQEYMIPEREFLEQNPQYHILATGAVVFDSDGKMLLVQRAKDEKAFPNFWEIPGGKVDDTDETLLHAVARELKEESGLDVTRFIRKVGDFGWAEVNKRTQQEVVWRKLIFEVEVKNAEVVLDPIEHQDYLWATEEEITADKVADIPLSWITLANKEMNLDAFRLRRETVAAPEAAKV